MDINESSAQEYIRLKKKTLLVSFDKGDGTCTETINETVKVMLEELVPDDKEDETTEGEKEIRIQMPEEITDDNEREYTEEELPEQ
ncbi:hypothetical protein J6590_092656 [Homalodisca vitripennis]|nr:hypothetical protein J6590_092656 [Homalodisca vitripennis]